MGCRLFLICITRLTYEGKKDPFLIGAMLINLAALILAGERSSDYGLLAGVLYMLMYNPSNSKFTRAKVWLQIILVIGLSVFFISGFSQKWAFGWRYGESHDERACYSFYSKHHYSIDSICGGIC